MFCSCPFPCNVEDYKGIARRVTFGKNGRLKITPRKDHFFDDILTNPQGPPLAKAQEAGWVQVIEAITPDGRGVVFDANGNFLYFKAVKG